MLPVNLNGWLSFISTVFPPLTIRFPSPSMYGGLVGAVTSLNNNKEKQLENTKLRLTKTNNTFLRNTINGVVI